MVLLGGLLSGEFILDLCSRVTRSNFSLFDGLSISAYSNSLISKAGGFLKGLISFLKKGVAEKMTMAPDVMADWFTVSISPIGVIPHATFSIFLIFMFCSYTNSICYLRLSTTFLI